jgi:hypothetical protein
MGSRDFLSKEILISLSDDRSGFTCREQVGKFVLRQQFVFACGLGEHVPLPDSPVEPTDRTSLGSSSIAPRPRLKH